MSRLFLLLAAACAVGACGANEPDVVTCGDDCPEVRGDGRDASTRDAGNAGRDAGPRDDEDTEGAGTGGRGGRGAAGAGRAGATGSAGEGDAAAAGEGGSDASTACDDCPPERPHCGAEATCVECLRDGDCEAGLCADGACVACRQDSDCTDPANSRCVQHECTPCSVSAECAHIAGLTVCDAGQCVQCTGLEYESCGSAPGGERHVCDVLARTCTTKPGRSADLCNLCVSDAQCGAGQLCVMQYFDEVGDAPDKGELEVGHVCFWRSDATEPGAPAGDCANARPYVAKRAGSQSIEGAAATVCTLALTTCVGFKDYRAKTCTSLADDASCGDSRFMSDASCEMFSGSTYRCTTPCRSDDDCDVGFLCIGTPSYCAPQ